MPHLLSWACFGPNRSTSCTLLNNEEAGSRSSRERSCFSAKFQETSRDRLVVQCIDTKQHNNQGQTSTVLSGIVQSNRWLTGYGIRIIKLFLPLSHSKGLRTHIPHVCTIRVSSNVYAYDGGGDESTLGRVFPIT